MKVRRALPLHAMAAVLALAVLAACGGGGGADAAEVVREAPEKTAAAGSARVALNITFSSAGTSAAVAGEGVVDLDEGRGALALNLGSLGAEFGASNVDAVLDRTGIFVKLPPNLASAAKPWIKLDLATLS